MKKKLIYIGVLLFGVILGGMFSFKTTDNKYLKVVGTEFIDSYIVEDSGYSYYDELCIRGKVTVENTGAATSLLLKALHDGFGTQDVFIDTQDSCADANEDGRVVSFKIGEKETKTFDVLIFISIKDREHLPEITQMPKLSVAELNY